jgi:hypothetical protein
MPFALLIVGVFLVIAGVRNTQDVLFDLVKADFIGTDNFIFWFLAIVAIGALGYIPRLKPLSTAFLGLVIVVLFLKEGNASGTGGGFFNQFLKAIQGTQSAAGTDISNAVNAATPSLTPLPLGTLGGSNAGLSASASLNDALANLRTFMAQDEQNYSLGVQ